LNFLSHYYYDHKKNQPYYNLGLLLPDLLRNFVRGTKIDVNSVSHQELESTHLKEGCLKHIASDVKFHNWNTFKNLMSDATRLMRTSAHPIQRDFFVSHIFIELLLDRSLLSRVPDLANQLYSDFEQVEIQAVNQFLNAHQFYKFEQFERGFKRFLDVRYLEHYTDPQIILYSTERICTKMRLPTFSKGQKSVLLDIIDTLDVTIVDATLELEELLQ
jgi:hypothetical protein